MPNVTVTVQAQPAATVTAVAGDSVVQIVTPASAETINIAQTGPQGPQGPQGLKGEQGEAIMVWNSTNW